MKLIVIIIIINKMIIRINPKKMINNAIYKNLFRWIFNNQPSKLNNKHNQINNHLNKNNKINHLKTNANHLKNSYKYNNNNNNLNYK